MARHISAPEKVTVYWETLTKDEFDESWPNRQTKTIQYFSFNISASIKLLSHYHLYKIRF